MTKAKAAPKLRDEIKQDILDQLERNGTIGKYYVDLAEDYMDLWDTKSELVKDIQKRGAVVKYVSNTGQVNLKKNESVDLRLKVNAQMLKLLAELGINPSQADSDDDDL